MFHFMRDNNIAFGLTESAVGTLYPQPLSPKFVSFIEKNPEVVHAEADVSWLTDAAEDEAMWAKSGSPGQSIRNKEEKGSHSRLYPISTGSRRNKRSEWRYHCTSASGQNCDDTSEVLHHSFFVGSLCPNCETGSLAFLRSSDHRVLVAYPAPIGTTAHSDFAEDFHAHTPSAITSLLRQGVWNFREKIFHHEVQTSMWLPFQPQAPAGSPREAAMLEQLYRWSHIAQDFLRQSISPGLQSGNTVVDERNFALL
jgi:mannosyltransferase